MTQLKSLPALLLLCASQCIAMASDAGARKTTWRAAMRFCLFEQAANLEARLGTNTLCGPERYLHLDSALTATNALAPDFLAETRLSQQNWPATQPSLALG